MTVWAFLDESGDPNLEVENGGSTHFAVAAVVVPDAELAERRAKVAEVRQRFFQSGEIKSSSVGKKKLARRLDILRALDATGYQMIGFVVDKRRLYRESGLQFRQSFVKFLNRFVYRRLFRAFPKLCIRADEHGSREFMQSFKAYLLTSCQQTTLFDTEPKVESVTSGSEVLVQAADFVAGSLRIAYGDEIGEKGARELLALFRRASLGIQEWPAVARSEATVASPSSAPDDDAVVRLLSERSAYAFLSQVEERDDDDSRMQVDVLQELLQTLRFEEEGHRSAEGLAATLRERGYPECSRDHVRRNIIAPMRDREVLIVSSEKGYRLPSKLVDVETHVQRMEHEVRPILRRVQTMQDLIKRASIGGVDLLSDERFAYLRGLLDQHQQLERSAREPIATAGEGSS